MIFFLALPPLTFILLLVLEKKLPVIEQEKGYTYWDYMLNGVGFFMQGCIVPGLGIWLSQSLLPHVFPWMSGVLEFGWWGCFIFNMVFVDFLYYWQHRAFHHFHFLWRLHECHHSTNRVDIWTTSRNSIWINFIFVYCLLNPLFGFLCDSREGFYAGAMVTASLDIFRHTRLDLVGLLPYRLLYVLSHIFVMPCQHHHHHSLSDKPINLAANFIFWDILFGTAKITLHYPQSYGVANTKHPLSQLLYPLE